MDRDDVKSILKATTSEAVREGAFGLPFIVIDPHQNYDTLALLGNRTL